eukprot:3500406-Rhodomonas_salina.1
MSLAVNDNNKIRIADVPPYPAPTPYHPTPLRHTSIRLYAMPPYPAPMPGLRMPKAAGWYAATRRRRGHSGGAGGDEWPATARRCAGA